MTTMNAEQFRATFPFFRNSPKKLIEEILSLSRHGSASRSTLMLIQDQICTGLELMVSGRKRVYKTGPASKEITLYDVGAGEVCVINAACVLSDTPSPVHSQAVTDVTFLSIPAEDFRNLLSTFPEMRAFVFNSLSETIVSVLELVGEIVFKKMDRRLFDYIVEKSENNTLATTHQQIANDLGTAREVVSRLLKDFESRGKVTLSRGQIRLISPYYDD